MCWVIILLLIILISVVLSAWLIVEVFNRVYQKLLRLERLYGNSATRTDKKPTT